MIQKILVLLQAAPGFNPKVRHGVHVLVRASRSSRLLEIPVPATVDQRCRSCAVVFSAQSIFLYMLTTLF